MLRLRHRLALPVSLVALFGLSYAFITAQAPPENVRVIEGATLIDVGMSGQDAVPYREAVFHQRLRSPRTFTSISRLVAEPEGCATGLESPYTPSRVPDSAQHARDLVKLWIDAGADYVIIDPDLLAYYPPSAIESVLNRYVRIDQGPLRERRMKGYENALRFHRMFVDAGGKIGNTNSTKAPGLDLHHEIQVMKDAGLTPMQIVQGTTKWPAEMIGKQDTLGTITVGTLADVILLSRDPLQDAANMRAFETVIQDGRIIERGYHANYSDPFINLGDPSVEALPWVLAMKKVFRASTEVGDPPYSPTPAIESITPLIVTQTNGNVSVTLKGFNFVRRSTVLFKGLPAANRVVSPGEIQVTLDADALKTVGKFDMVVRNPDPIDPAVQKGMWGNGTSNVAHLIVNYRY